MPSPISATRNWTITETSVTLASGQISRKVVGMATSAINSGTVAMNDRKTKTRTTSAASAASRVPSRTPVPDPSLSPAEARSASRPVAVIEDPPTVTPASAACASRASAWPGSTPPRCGTYTSAKVVRPSSETNARSRVEA
jgi:hypothetical protein